MRKLFWCCSAAGALALGSLFAATYYTYCEPESAIGRCITTAANASVSLQPVAEFTAMVVGVSHHVLNPQETASVAGSDEVCIPEDPQPIAIEPVEIVRVEKPVRDEEPEAAPIVIHEDDPMPPVNEELLIPATIEIGGLPNGLDNSCPMVMPYCNDDEERAATRPIMPYVEDDGKKAETVAKDSEDNEFKAWIKLLNGTDQASTNNDTSAEELPAPTEEPSAEPKCQEDSRIHEHYSGSPCTRCPYTGKRYPDHVPPNKAGKEESSEEPIHHHRSLKRSGKGEESLPRTEGVDTMEYRPSDGGLNEFGRGPL